MKNLILIGMPGAGKSTLGVLLAKALGLDFVDTDLLIQAQEGKLLRELIAQLGSDGFLALEGRTCAALTLEHSVVATGGSVVYEPEAMAHLKSLGTIVYLALDYPSLERRLDNLTRRGVVLQPGQTLKTLYDERVPLYRRYADLTVDCGGGDIEHSLAQVLEALEQ
ncbi:MAG: shikimate kinase [Ruminiclostridium sp.]|jgi:shikimate kinase|nr:shikimate kinase [Ruminiclostridium sp.]